MCEPSLASTEEGGGLSGGHVTSWQEEEMRREDKDSNFSQWVKVG